MRPRRTHGSTGRAGGQRDDPAPARSTDATVPRGGGVGVRLALGLACITAAALGGYLMTPQARAAGLPAAKHGIPFNGTSAVGALFTVSHGSLGRHFCTASVVRSPNGNLLITAAHCMDGRSLSRVEFAPGYHDGKFPHGIWIVRELFVDNAWLKDRNPNDDFAFLIAGRPGTHIQRHTGAERLAVFEPPQVVKVIGYPDRTSTPITCTNRARSFLDGRQMVFDCNSYTEGTSGGPFLVHASSGTGDGWVIGVIGGYQQGGDTADVSYSARFFSSIRKLYQAATAAPAALTSG
jgi:V8-like Glu-specific endopeptidase